MGGVGQSTKILWTKWISPLRYAGVYGVLSNTLPHRRHFSSSHGCWSFIEGQGSLANRRIVVVPWFCKNVSKVVFRVDICYLKLMRLDPFLEEMIFYVDVLHAGM